MSGFISSPAPAATPPGAMLECGPFWPDIDLNHFRDSQRIGGTLIPDQRVKDALLGGVMAVEVDLGAWRTALEEGGNVRLADVPQPQIGNEKRLLMLFRRAVYAYATADLVETHRDVTASGPAQNALGEMDQRAEDHRRIAIHAVRDMLGTGRTTVGLI